MTTSIPTKSPDLSSASGGSSAAAFFGGDAGAGAAPQDFATLLDGNAAEPTATDTATAGKSTRAASVLAGAVVAPTLDTADVEAVPPAQAPTREAIEQAAALLASLWKVLQPETPVQAGAMPETGADAMASGSAEVKVTLQWGDQSPVVLTLPAGAQPPADLAAQVGEQVSAIFDQTLADAIPAGDTTADENGFKVPDSQPGETPELSISMEIAAAATATIQAPTTSSKGLAKVSLNGTEKFAGKFSALTRANDSARDVLERNFLVAKDEEVTKAEGKDGIGVAKPEGTMPAFFATRHLTPERFESVAQSWMSDSAPTQPSADSLAAPAESTAAASLARKAVDTIQGVLETQHIRTDHMGVVSLNFKFGAEDLAVRVQLRNGEVHTQFRTDSTELRAALSDEWHALVVGQGGDQASRLIDPVFSPSNSSLAHQHSGSSGQGFAQKQQQEAQAPFALPEVRTFRRGLGAATAAAAEVAPQIARNLPTSLHLTAFA